MSECDRLSNKLRYMNLLLSYPTIQLEEICLFSINSGLEANNGLRLSPDSVPCTHTHSSCAVLRVSHIQPH